MPKSPPPKPPRKPTLADVASAAGVSKGTVSKVLNRRANISAETRQRVERAVSDLGYAPSTGLRTADLRPSIMVVFDSLENVYAMQVLDGVMAAAQEQGVDVLVDAIRVGNDADGRPGSRVLSVPWIRHQAKTGRTGVLIVATESTSEQQELLRSLGLAVVLVDPSNPLDADVVSVGATNFAGAVQAVNHLLALGHRRIAFAGGPSDSLPSLERKQGFLSALASNGVEADPTLVMEQDFSVAAGLKMATKFLELPEPPTAIFAASDLTAFGVLEAARRRNLRVPQDLSVIGFDDTFAATFTAPPLTTVRQPINAIGRVALRTLLQQARNEPIDSRHVQLMTQLVVRESTAPPPARAAAADRRLIAD